MDISSCINWGDVSTEFCENGLSVIHINMRSIGNKFNELVAHLNAIEKKFSLIILCETWLSIDRDVGYELDGYKSRAVYRISRSGGGIKVFYLDHLSVNFAENFSGCFDDYECLLLKIMVPNFGKLNVCAIYRIPNTDFNNFIQNLQQIILFLNSERSIFAGDFNLNTIQTPLCNRTNEYNNMMQSFGYENFINVPTYISPQNDTETSCLDHIWANFACRNARGFTVGPNLSDHYAVCCIFDIFTKNVPEKIKFRNFCQENIQKFESNATHEFNSFLPPSNGINEYATYLKDFIMKLINKYFPIMTKQISKKRMKSPWVTDEIVRCIRKKHAWFRLLKRNRITRNSYNEYCRALKNVFDIAEDEYFRNKFNSLSGDQAKNWKILNSLLGKNTEALPDHFIIDNESTHDKDKITAGFSKYFHDHPLSIHQSIPSSTEDFSQLIPFNENNMFFAYATADEISRVILQLKSGGGLDDVPVKVLKMVHHKVSIYLSKLFNLCLLSGDYPEIFKISRITPVFKKGSREMIENYRPIAIVLNLSKVFDNLIFTRIQSFFSKFNLLSENQYGFRKGKNTELAIMKLTSEILPAVSQNKFCICIFLDYRACFDTICREIFFEKLFRYGVRGVALDLVKSYFIGRKQWVNFKSNASNIENQDIGVIQGCKTGPMFFDIYCNEFQKLMGEDNYVLYADDTAVVFVGDDLEELVRHVNNKLRRISDWCKFNKLALNPTKSEFMLITNRKIENIPKLYIDQDEIKRVDTVKYLGCFIDDKLKFHVQINHIEAKLSRYCGVSYRLKQHFNRDTALKYYYSCVYGTIRYCLANYGGVAMCTRRCQRVESLQKRIVENLFRNFCQKDGCIFKEMKLLKFPDIYRASVSSYMFQVMILKYVPCLEKALSLGYPSHSHDTRHRDRIELPFPRIESIRMNFQYQFSRI